MIGIIKFLLNLFALLIVFFPWLSWKIEAILWGSSRVYLFWAQTWALVPGIVGNFLRRAYYWLVFPRVSWQCEIGFGSFFSHPWAIIEKNVYIGPYCILGKVILGEGSLISSRVSIPSGKRQHLRSPEGHLLPAQEEFFQVVTIGKYVWIGEGAIVMADVGNFSTIAAGSVVVQKVPAKCLVAGNPARIIKRLK